MESEKIKKKSEDIIKSLGGKTNDWLPCIELSEPRESRDVAARALVMHGMLQLVYGAPKSIISRWIQDNDLNNSLCKRDRSLLELPEGDLSDQDRTDLHWYIEAIWAFIWAGQFINKLDINENVGENIASLLPDIEKGYNGNKFKDNYILRPYKEVYEILDLYYRANWYARDGELKGYSTGVFNTDIIMERRKALEFINNKKIEDWDDIEIST